MRGSLFLIALLASTLLLSETIPAGPMEVWPVPFDLLAAGMPDASAGLTLDDALRLVAARNPSLKALTFRRIASESELRQAGAWPNPELETVVEEVGWDAPGFEESGITISLRQELELFGRRSARRQSAQAGIHATGLAARLSAFDLYLEVKSRFFATAHAQEGLVLSDSSVALTRRIFDDISLRFEKGAALRSELMLARLEFERANLERAEAAQAVRSARFRLAALWGGTAEGISVIGGGEVDSASVLSNLWKLTGCADSSREVMLLQIEAQLAEAERRLAVAEARPTISLTAGYKRLNADGSNSLLIGIGVPLPVWNRNQGRIAALEAKAQSLELERLQAVHEATADIRSGTERLVQLVSRCTALDSVLLPAAEGAYDAVRTAYEAGRLALTALLDAERSLIEQRSARNDVVLSIHEEIIALERIAGVMLR